MADRLELETFRVRDRTLGPIEVTGYVIGRIDTRQGAPEQHLSRRRPRWGVNTVFLLRDHTYVLVTEAFSTLYHTSPTTCRIGNGLPSGDQTTVEAMARELESIGLTMDDAVSCDVCKPDWPEDLAPTDLVRYEFPRRQVVQAENGRQITSALVTSRKYSGTRSTRVPEPTRALLALCQANDPEFYSADEPAIKIG